MKNKGCWWIIGAILAISVVIAIFEHAISWLILGILVLFGSGFEYWRKEKNTFIVLLIIGIILVAGSSYIMIGQHLTEVDEAKAAKIDKKRIAKADDLTNGLSNDSKKEDFVKANSAANKVINKKTRKEIKAAISEDKQNWVDSRKPVKRIATSSSSSQKNQKSKNQKFLKNLNKLNKGTAQYAKFDVKTNTVTWIGYDNWNNLSHSDLQKSMDILETITNKSATEYNIRSPKIIAKTPSGAVIAKAAIGQDLAFTN